MRGVRARNGATKISQNGYHYTKREDKWYLTHRLIVEEVLGRPITPEERVRFLDKDKTNLSVNNLEVYQIKQRSVKAQIAELESKRDDIDAKLEILKSQESL